MPQYPFNNVHFNKLLQLNRHLLFVSSAYFGGCGQNQSFKLTFISITRTAASSALCEFQYYLISQVRRKSASADCTAAEKNYLDGGSGPFVSPGHRPVTRMKFNQTPRDFTKFDLSAICRSKFQTFIFLQLSPFGFNFLHPPNKCISPMACKRSGVRFPLAPPLIQNYFGIYCSGLHGNPLPPRYRVTVLHAVPGHPVNAKEIVK